MIIVKAKSSASSSPLNIGSNSASSNDTDSFSKLLESIASTQKSGKHSIKDGPLLLHVKDEKEIPSSKLTAKDVKDLKNSKDVKENSKKNELLSLLKNSGQNASDQDTKSIMINPQLAAALDTKALKTAIKDAKSYLKDQIKNTPEYIKGDIKELPKTTKGLVALAKKSGVDVEKITLETVQLKNKKDTDPKESLTKNIKSVKLEDNGKIKTTITKDTKITLASKNDDAAQKLEIKTTSESVLKQPQSQQQQQQQLQVDETLTKTPLFKLLQTTVPSHSTAELVNKKQVKNEKIAGKSESALIALLHGDKNLSKQVSSAEAKTDSTLEAKHKTHSSVLSQLLHGDTQENKHIQQESADIQGLKSIESKGEHSVHAKDSESDLGVKIHEAKQMLKYLAQDIKQAIEDYKPPFTRIKVKLNPAKLGEVDLTVIQRGKNVHVNISSNSAAINTLAQNANDLKVQLNQNGMNNATLNFNSSSDQQGQQQSGQQRQHAKKAYEFFDNDEANEEILSSLEIVVPRYI
ncbi:flagellar hook-length control protein FliK [bacterium]|nr:flagellar hook-length control protein FliK [bacterium]MBU1884558.1 flagellar hook-length control protein FliK [bacterium]